MFRPVESVAGVILAAGKGTRLKSHTLKVFHRVCGREIISILVDVVRDSGCAPVSVVVPPDDAPFKTVLGDRVSYVIQEEARGTGHALLQARDSVGDSSHVAVFNGDWPLLESHTISDLIVHHLSTGAAATFLTSTPTSVEGLGRVVRDASGSVRAVVEEDEAKAEGNLEVLAIEEVNAGVYCFDGAWVWDVLPDLRPSPNKSEVFLTDLIAAAVSEGRTVAAFESDQPYVNLGINTRIQLAETETALRQRIREKWMLEGVTMTDPSTVYIDPDAKLGQDTVILPNTHLLGTTVVGSDCEIGPNSIVRDSVLGNRCHVVASVIERSTLGNDVHVGPFTQVRAGSYLADGTRPDGSADVISGRTDSEDRFD